MVFAVWCSWHRAFVPGRGWAVEMGIPNAHQHNRETASAWYASGVRDVFLALPQKWVGIS